jgi:hypothetical protein
MRKESEWYNLLANSIWFFALSPMWYWLQWYILTQLKTPFVIMSVFWFYVVVSVIHRIICWKADAERRKEKQE